MLLKRASYYMFIIFLNGIGWNRGRAVEFHISGLIGTASHPDM
jgi:hypothetical protein